MLLQFYLHHSLIDKEKKHVYGRLRLMDLNQLNRLIAFASTSLVILYRCPTRHNGSSSGTSMFPQESGPSYGVQLIIVFLHEIIFPSEASLVPKLVYHVIS